MTEIPNNQRLIVALDFPNIEQSQKIVEELGDEVTFYKIGLELLMSGDYFTFLDWLSKKNKKVFVDLKLHDISATTSKAIKNLSNYPNIELATIHTTSTETMRQVAANKGNIKIVAVTVLTNLNQNDLVDIGFENEINLSKLVLKRAILAKECGLDGVVASGLEAEEIRKITGEKFIIVSPGVRPTQNNNDDQKRVVNVQTALKNGSDYLVIGRPITKSENPKQTARQIQQQITQTIQQQ